MRLSVGCDYNVIPVFHHVEPLCIERNNTCLFCVMIFCSLLEAARDRKRSVSAIPSRLRTRVNKTCIKIES